MGCTERFSFVDIRSWDERKVGEWLRSIDFAKYENDFEENNITGEALLECDHSVLKELGVKKVGDRVRIVVAIKALRTRAYGNGKKRNRDTLAALDNLPNYRSNTHSLYNLTPPGNSKRYSRTLPLDSVSSTLTGASYNRPDSPSENEYPRSYGNRAPNPRSMMSPPLETSRSTGFYPTTPGHPSRTPKTPYGEYGNKGPLNSPQVRIHNHKSSSSLDGIMSIDVVRQNCIKVIGDGGESRVVEISGCNTAEAIKKKIVKKFSGSMDGWAQYCIYNIEQEQGREIARNVSDKELLQISQDVSRPERARLILRRRGLPPSPQSTEFLAAQQIAREQQDSAFKNTADAIHGNASKPKVASLTGKPPHEIRPMSPGLSPYSTALESPASPGLSPQGTNHKSKKIAAFFGQRPPSELISSNLAEYFPDHEPKSLERTVRNSIRRSTRMSRYNRLSVATTRSYASSHLSLSDVPPIPSVGDAWLNASPSGAYPPSLGGRNSRPGSIRKSFLPSTSFSADHRDSLVPVYEEDDGATLPGSRKSYTSFNNSSQETLRMGAVDVVVTDTDNESTINGSTLGSYVMDQSSGLSTPATEVFDPRMSGINQFLNTDDSEEDEDEDEDEDQEAEENWSELRWMKGALIGAGSFGSVFLALNALTGELMAVKQVEMPSAGKEDARKKSMVEALQREIELLKDMQHPNIVQYLGSSNEDDSLNIFLEYVPGGSVAALLNNYGPLKEPLIRNFVRQILTGLAYLHNKDIIHRDIKGANVLVDNKGGIKISDFGISKKVEAGLLTSSSNHRPSLQGSVFWMAPEVVKQTSYTLKADIWSLGCLIVEMFTGSHPYPDCSQLQAIFKIGTGGSAPTIPQKSTAEAKQFLGQTFELDHNKRPTADELLLNPFMTPMVGAGSQNE
ncbi:hypothetical protein DFP73DRAFT_298054 [Morchella snyderi]|nr:hypothetical protein DFP73DRAFT_298054 [Morchella snyderi]